MSKLYLYSFVFCLLFVFRVFAEVECSAETGICGGSEKETEFAVRAASAGYGCAASINISYIPQTARIEVVDGSNQILADYQVTVVNIATCVISAADIQITVPGGAAIRSTTNLNKAGQQEGAYELVLRTFTTLPPGSTYTNASFTASFVSSGYARTFDATIVAKCDSCETTIGTSASCRAETSATLRFGTSGYNTTSGKYYGQYDVLIVNIGACGIYEVGLDFSLTPGTTITQTNGLTQTYGVGQYKATGFRNNQVRIMQGDTLPIETRYTASFSAEFTSPAVTKFTVDSTSLCRSSCDGSLSTPAPARGQCSVVVASTWIPGSPRSVVVDGVTRIAADYEVFVANYGQCSVSSVTITFNPYSGSALTNATNLQSTGQTNQYTINFASDLSSPGSTYNKASITAIFQSTGYAYQIPVSAVTPQCDSSCSERVTSTASPTAAPPTTASPTASPVTCTPTTPAPTPNNGCTVIVSQVLRTTWKSGTTDNRLYDIIIDNTGSSVAQTADISFVFGSESSVTQSWNLGKVSSTVYRANLFAAPPGRIVQSSGYVLTNEETAAFTAPTTALVSVQC